MPFKIAPVPVNRTTQETTQEMASKPQKRICRLPQGEHRLTRRELAERLNLRVKTEVKSQVKSVPHSQSHGHHSVKTSVETSVKTPVETRRKRR